MTNSRRRVGRWTVVVRDLHLGPVPLGYLAHLEDGPMFRASFPSTLIYITLGERFKQILGWWRPTFIKALNKGYQEAYA